jgi:single-strand DNA-binding protein
MKMLGISGNIGRDAETRTTQGGDIVTSWTVAVEERRGQDKRTIWFECSLWGKRGESLAQYLTKGGKVSVSGELSTREHDGKTYLTVRADQVTLMGGGARDDDRGMSDKAKAADRAQRPAARDDLEDDVPF